MEDVSAADGISLDVCESTIRVGDVSMIFACEDSEEIVLGVANIWDGYVRGACAHSTSMT